MTSHQPASATKLAHLAAQFKVDQNWRASHSIYRNLLKLLGVPSCDLGALWASRVQFSLTLSISADTKKLAASQSGLARGRISEGS